MLVSSVFLKQLVKYITIKGIIVIFETNVKNTGINY